MSFKINKDKIQSNIHAVSSLKIPRYEGFGGLGNEQGYEGNILLNRTTKEFCYHDGEGWTCIDGTVGSLVTLSDSNDGVPPGPGVSLIADGLGPDLELYTLLSTDASISIGQIGDVINFTANVGNITSSDSSVDITIVGNNYDLSVENVNVGGGAQLYRSLSTSPFEFRTLISPLGSISITQTANTIELESTGSGGSSLWTLANTNDFVQDISNPGVSFGGNNLTFGANGTESTEVGANTTRFFFISDSADPSYGSLRAGTATAAQWDVANRGLNSVAFGVDNQASAETSSILGGSGNVIQSGSRSSAILAGGDNRIEDTALFSAIVCGERNFIRNQVDNTRCGILAGSSNEILVSVDSSISSGFNSQINLSNNSSMSSGTLNLISQAANSFIGAGSSNQIFSSDNISIVSGSNHIISASSNRCSVLTGNTNVIEESTNSSILSGETNTIRNSNNSSIMASNNCTIAGVDNCSIISGPSFLTNNSEQRTLWTTNLRTFGGRRKLVRVILPATPNPFIPSAEDHIIYIDTVGLNARTIQLPLNPIEGTEYYIRLDAKNLGHTTTVQATPPNVINWTGPQGTIPQPALGSFTMGAIAGQSGTFTAHLVFAAVVGPPAEWIVLDLH